MRGVRAEAQESSKEHFPSASDRHLAKSHPETKKTYEAVSNSYVPHFSSEQGRTRIFSRDVRLRGLRSEA